MLPCLLLLRLLLPLQQQLMLLLLSLFLWVDGIVDTRRK